MYVTITVTEWALQTHLKLEVFSRAFRKKPELNGARRA